MDSEELKKAQKEASLKVAVRSHEAALQRRTESLIEAQPADFDEADAWFAEASVLEEDDVQNPRSRPFARLARLAHQLIDESPEIRAITKGAEERQTWCRRVLYVFRQLTDPENPDMCDDRFEGESHERDRLWISFAYYDVVRDEETRAALVELVEWALGEYRPDEEHRLGSQERELLQAMLELDAVTREGRMTQDEVSAKAWGQARDAKKPFARLRKAGLTNGVGGARGGVWLTKPGTRAAKRIVDGLMQ